MCFFFLNSASWGAIPSACFVCCTCALKYNNIIYNIYIYNDNHHHMQPPPHSASCTSASSVFAPVVGRKTPPAQVASNPQVLECLPSLQDPSYLKASYLDPKVVERFQAAVAQCKAEPCSPKKLQELTKCKKMAREKQAQDWENHLNHSSLFRIASWTSSHVVLKTTSGNDSSQEYQQANCPLC